MEPSSPPSSHLSSFVEPRKLFVGSITDETEESALREYFEKYGQVKEVVVMRERDTGKVRGFGFVEFVDKEAAEKALDEKGKHLIRDQAVEVKRARPKSYERRNYQSPHRLCHTLHETRGGRSSTRGSNNDDNYTSTRKIFVGGLSSNITVDEFRSYFEKFGCITDVVIMYDNVKHHSRGFGFITFDSEEAAKNAMHHSFHELNEKIVEVKRAVPKEANHYMNVRFYCGNNSNYSGGWGRENNYGNYQPEVYLPYDPRYWYFYSYAPPPLPGYPFEPVGYEEGYTYGGSGEISSGAPYASPGDTWNGQGMMAASSVSYSNAAFDPRYVNTMPGAYMGMAAGAYHRAVWSGNSRLNRNINVLPRNEAKITKHSEVQNIKVDVQ